MHDPTGLAIEVAYARPDAQVVLNLTVPPHTTIGEAIQRSRIIEIATDIDINNENVGVFGKLRKLSDIVVAGDRIEIYRPLICDPKEVRRQRARAG